jgi:hypothetical protein
MPLEVFSIRMIFIKIYLKQLIIQEEKINIQNYYKIKKTEKKKKMQKKKIKNNKILFISMLDLDYFKI